MPRGPFGRIDQFQHLSPALEELFCEAHQRIQIVRIPFGRKLAQKFIEHALRHALFDPFDPRLKGFSARNAQVNAISGIKPAQRGIGKSPFPGIKAKTLIDHYGFINRVIWFGLFPALPRGAKKKSLPPVRVTGPFVKSQHAGKIMQVFDARQ